MYTPQAHAGNSPDFWEETWEASEFEESVRFSAVDPLRPLFEKYLRTDSLMLEGGCGMGNYLAYYSARGYNVIGVDFAQQALKTLRIRQPQLKLCGGDVSRLPFADKTFDLYYSGGVVEHFETGADESIREARRVLKADGVLLISVPFYNPIRQIFSPFRKDDWRVVQNSRTDNEAVFEDKKFFQYAYTLPEFTKMLTDAGLEVIETQGYAILWGLYELPFLNRSGKSEFAAVSKKREKKEVGNINMDALVNDRPSSLLKRLVVSEDDSVPVLGLGVRFMRRAAGNMMMYACKRG